MSSEDSTMDQPRQSVKGASTYDKISLSQKNNFQRLLSLVEIKQGWKILDIGCGTGNRTKSLAHLVGESGKIIGIDPIEKRIDEAKMANSAPNVEYHVGFGETACCDFGSDFDLVIAATVMHWIPFEKQKILYRNVESCLKPGGSFIFNCMITEKSNYLKFLPFLSTQELAERTRGSLFCCTKQEFRATAHDSGYATVEIVEKDVKTTFASLDQMLQHFASSNHAVDFEMFLQELKDVITAYPNEISFAKDEVGEFLL